MLLLPCCDSISHNLTSTPNALTIADAWKECEPAGRMWAELDKCCFYLCPAAPPWGPAVSSTRLPLTSIEAGVIAAAGRSNRGACCCPSAALAPTA